MATRGLLMSGGLDSVAAWWALGKPEWVHYIANIGVEGAEIRALDRLREALPEFAECGEVVEMDPSAFSRTTPASYNGLWWHREVVLALLMWARGYNEVMTAVHRDDLTSYRKDMDESELISKLLSEFFIGPRYIPFKYITAVGHLSRREIVEQAIAAGATAEWLALSHSCTYSNNMHCGVCPSCAQRHLAFLGVMGEDPTVYLQEPVPEAHCLDNCTYKWYEQDYRLGLGIPDDETIVMGGEAPDLANTTRFTVPAPGPVYALDAVPDNGAMVASAVLKPADRNIMQVLYDGPPVRLSDLLLIVNAGYNDPREAPILDADAGDEIYVHLGIVEGQVDSVSFRGSPHG